MTVTPDIRPERLFESPQGLPAGGPDPQRFDWAEAWHPVHYVQDLDKARPTAFTLLGRDRVIWWDPQGESWRVFDDTCPHRLAPLSEGRVNEAGQLECPYHGWAFSGSGACEQIPQAASPAACQSSRACVESLPTTVAQGLLFVYPGKPENAPRVPVPVIPALEEEPEGWVMMNTFRDIPYDALTLLENVIDASHIPYTHHNTVSKRENAAPMEMSVVTADRQGFQGIWPEGPRKGKLGTQHTTFVAPGLMYHDLTAEQFGRTLTVVYATPIRKGECRVFARFPFKFQARLPKLFIRLSPRWYTHLNQNGVLEDDQIFLHIQERRLAAAGDRTYAQACYLPTQADRLVVALRQWISQFEADPFPGAPLPPAQTPVQLLDRYQSHTQHCRSCRNALKRIDQIRRGSAIAFLVLWGSLTLGAATTQLPLSAVIAGVGLSLGLAGLWAGLGQLRQRFYHGRQIPPRNQAKSK